MSDLYTMAGNGRGDGNYGGIPFSSSSSSAAVGNGGGEREVVNRRMPRDYGVDKVSAALIMNGLEEDQVLQFRLDNLKSEESGFYHYPKSDRKHRLKKRGKLSVLPQSIKQEVDGIQFNTFRGLLPEINRVYVTVDSTLYLWNYETGESREYNRLGQVITTVSVVKPKSGIFSHDINYLLVIATPVEIVLLGCSFGGNNVNGELSLYETHFYVPTDNIPIARIVGTSTGRIFMCGLDGCLYELDYQNEESWFRGKCRKLNHSRGVFRQYLPQILYFDKMDEPMLELIVDETRRPSLLYAFSRNDKTNKSTLTLYSLGKNGDDLKELCRNKQNVADVIKKATGQSLPKNKTYIVSLATIPNYDTESLLLVGITNQGIRLFYTMKTNRYGTRELIVQLVRLCPPYVKLSHQQNQKSEYSRKPEYKEDCSPKNVKKAYYHKGILLLADASSDRADNMIAITPEHVQAGSKEGGVGPRYGLNEVVHSAGQFQMIFDLSEKSEEFYLYGQPGSYANFLYAGVGKGQAYDMPIRGLRELAVQHVLPNRQFICLTADGIQTYEKMWPVDELREVLRQVGDKLNDREITQFFSTYGVQETCAMCLIIACSAPRMIPRDVSSNVNSSLFNVSADSSRRLNESKFDVLQHSFNQVDNKHYELEMGVHEVDDPHLKKLATAVFLREAVLSGRAKKSGGHSSSSVSSSSSSSSARGGASSSSSSTTRGSSSSRSTKSGFSGHSGIHEGLELYMSRILRPIWNWSIVQNFGTSNNPELRLRYSADQFATLLQPLRKLKDFLKQNEKSLFHQDWNTYGRQERESLYNLIGFFDICVEAVSLLRILADQTKPNFTDIAESMRRNKNMQQQYKLLLNEREDFRFLNFVTEERGTALSKSLIDCMLQPMLDPLNERNNNETAMHVIHRLYRECPVFFNKDDMTRHQASAMLQSALLSSPHQQKAIRVHALELYKESCINAEFPIVEVCRNLREKQFHIGAVKLAMERINLLHRREVKQPRRHLGGGRYDSVMDPDSEEFFLKRELDECYVAITELLKALTSGPFDMDKQAQQHVLSLVLDTCLKSNYLELHDCIYTWLIENGQKQQLLELQYPSLENFLNNQIEANRRDDGGSDLERRYLDILQAWYSRHQQYFKAVVLYERACARRSSSWNHADRRNMLREALLFAQHCTLSSEGRERAEVGSIIETLRSQSELANAQALLIARLEQTYRHYSGGDMEEMDSINLKQSFAKNFEHQSLHDLQRILVDLNERLLTLEELNDLSEDWRCYEVGLALMAVFKHRNEYKSHIHAIWKNVIRYCVKQNQQSWRPMLQEKLKDLVDLYRDSPVMLPLEVIVDELEHRNTDNRASYEAEFVMETLLDACRLPFSQLITAYMLLEVPTKENVKLGVCTSAYILCTRLIAELSRTHGKPRSGFRITDVAELLSKYKAELDADSPDERQRVLYQEYAALEADRLNMGVNQLYPAIHGDRSISASANRQREGKYSRSFNDSINTSSIMNQSQSGRGVLSQTPLVRGGLGLFSPSSSSSSAPRTKPVSGMPPRSTPTTERGGPPSFVPNRPLRR